jgi:hypothetical protein
MKDPAGTVMVPSRPSGRAKCQAPCRIRCICTRSQASPTPAARHGHDSLWAGERVLVPDSPADGLFGVPGLPWADFYRGNADPLVALTLAAAVTERVQLGTSVLVAGLHQPFRLARELCPCPAHPSPHSS